MATKKPTAKTAASETPVDKSEPGVADPATTGTADPLTTPAPATTEGTDSETSPDIAAVQPIIDSMEANTSSDAKSKIDAALGGIGETPAPTMVNGKYVGDKKLVDGEWVDDPDKVQAVRPEDVFDRIGNAFPNEAQRLVLEEIARAAGLTAEGTVDLPEGMPTRGKSTASLRTDLTGYGAFAGGKDTAGPAPVPVGRDGKSQLSDTDVDDGK